MFSFSYFFRWLIGTKGGRATLGLVAFAIMGVWFYSWAESNGKLECQVAVVQESTQETQRQLKAAREAEQKAKERASEAEKKNSQYEIRLQEYEREVRSSENADSMCLSAVDVERLLELEGDSGS